MVKIKYVDISIEQLDNDTANLIVNTDIIFKKKEAAVTWKLYVKFWEHDIITKEDIIGPIHEDLPPQIIQPKLPDRQPPPDEFSIHKRILFNFPNSQFNKDIGDEEIYAELKITPDIELSEDTAYSFTAST